ncbi:MULTISPECIES: 3-methyl-2-oxobutanoate dehydrogenase subunit VorB [Desulfobacula]|uniref:KorA: 2-oxoglutarate synthase, alpha subunit (2-ketoglutarate oxidoreductase alpha chain) n=2 Tax=Desulfobacula TaxID=28222 RepID=K0N453_DESTT|nr:MULTISPECIES: 3-methyl-2-oxobutanoate dehydrogenase subunit VorB [Desulfobacula]CCK78884.1 KorA: 2-oxoglutarate synthase, alpha subunit (2-ketoglutarate oxidoreductase alpha chain) [Desulfobacula toluolica Tol2]SDU10223.1 2-oxoglutarate ferredoxin oxidoreductase subunit alpha [Desulfobacula phenolica]
MAKVLMKGNEAIGEAAIRAGCKNYFAYPITPQSEVAEYLAKRLPEVDGVFLQGESEVAVGYMIFGAAGAGERVMTTSSSPGISLMSEALSYIAGAQCPAVFVNIMRGGPGLGGILPSQGDYFQATKGGGHGDYHLLVLAPDGVQEAVEMTMSAFTLAEKYRGPVMIMGDGLIGQMMEPVEFPEDLKTEPSDKDDWATTGMDNRKSGKRNLVKSLFLDPTELNNNNLALKAKYDQMKKEDVQYEGYNTDTDYKVLIVSYGTMSRVCKTAIDMMKEEGIEVGLLRPKTLFPFPEKAVFDAATKESCKSVISIEMSMGQMVEDVERCVKGQREVDFYGECGGDIPTPEKITDIIKRLL